MLYRNRELPSRPSLLRHLADVIAHLSRARRRRLVEFDLMTANPHLKRDLGLHDVDLFDCR